MALFTDGPPSTIDDLVQHDSFLLGVASTEGIDVTAKLSLASTELTVEMDAIFGREASIYAPVLGQAPLNVANLSVTSALKLWHSFQSLALVYRDAYFNQLNDRYKGKWTEYQSLANWGKGRFIDTGAGLVIDPLPIPGPPITFFTTAIQGTGTIYISLTFINAASQESSPAVMSQIMVPDSNALNVGSPTWPINAVGWNVYAGTSPTAITMQNSEPLVLGQTWQCLFANLISGSIPGTGQAADVTRDLPRRIMRG